MQKPIKLYLAGPLTGLIAYDVVTRSLEAQAACRKFGVIPLDPVEEEGVKSGSYLIQAPPRLLRSYWKRDKELLAQADALIDLNANYRSDGVYWEMGIMKFVHKRPVIRVYPNGVPKAAISLLEADYVTETVEDGLRWLTKRLKGKRV